MPHLTEQLRVQLLEAADQFGCPLYVYNTDRIAKQIQSLKDAFSKTNVGFKYAAKALSNINILKFIRQQGLGLDAVSIQEVHLGLKAGFKSNQIMYTPNCVSWAEIVEGIELGVRLNIDNIPMLKKLGETYGSSVPVCIRINPHIMAGGNANISVGHIDSKFGISFHQIHEILEVVDQYNLHVNGVHMHTGSDILENEVFLRGAQILFNIAKNFKDLTFVDLGSGFKVPYKENDVVTDIDSMGEAISESFEQLCADMDKDLQLFFEPGKYIVSAAGYLLTKVNVVKHSPSAVFAGVDSGLNHLIRPMMYGSYHDIVNLSNPTGEKHVYNVVGYICETDTFGSDRRLNEVREGDILCFQNAGAYCFSMASNYNSRFRPAEVLIHEGKLHLIRKREEMEDLLKHQIEVI